MPTYNPVRLPPHPPHVNPSPNRTAQSPYNFVPLPEKVITVDQLPDHEQFVGNSGYFDVKLTTRSPLYIRAPLTETQFDAQEKGHYADDAEIPRESSPEFRKLAKNIPEFFYTDSKEADLLNRLTGIPGSSLRGMLRTLLEIVGYGKMQWLTDKKLFYRTMDNSAVGVKYRGRMTTGNIQSGFIRYDSTERQYKIQSCPMVRIPRTLLGEPKDLYESKNDENLNPMKTPRWAGKPGKPHQYAQVWVQLSGDPQEVVKISYQEQSKDLGYKKGVLVITGDMPGDPGKQREFVFLLDAPGDPFEVDPAIIQRFHDDDQVTQWQQKAFPKDKPEKKRRERDGLLSKNAPDPGDPIFFLRENGELTFIGRAMMFRLPYGSMPLDRVPYELRDPETVDLAEALFGFVRTDQAAKQYKQGNKARAYAGRVSVTDACLIPDKTEIWYNHGQIVTPPILSAPKPTAFQHYLVQTKDEKDQLTHYDHPEAQIRGHKLYWRRGNRSIPETTPPETSTQHTQFRAVNPDKNFKFRVYFENLTEVELGALCWILSLPLEAGRTGFDYCHMLGMGKPFGMGAVKLAPILYLTDRRTRYTTIFNYSDTSAEWEKGIRDESSKIVAKAKSFEQYIAKQLSDSKQFDQIDRIKELRMMLEWWEGDMWGTPGLLDHMTLKEFKERPVLPEPTKVNKGVNRRAAPPLPPIDAPIVTGIEAGQLIKGIVDLPPDAGGVSLKVEKWENLNVTAYIPAALLGRSVYREGNAATCIVVEVTEEDDGLVVKCRPATKEERNPPKSKGKES